MKKTLAILGALAIPLSSWGACIGGGACGPATRYDVNVQEVALCSDATCTSNYIVGSGARTFDIASATVGSAIGSYAKVDAVPVGVYTHVRVVVSRTFTISGPLIAGGGGCGVQNGVALSIPNNNPGGLDAALNGVGIFWHDGAKSQIRMTQALPAPIAIARAGTRPAVLVKFNTQEGLMCLGATPYPAPPDVTLSMN